MNTFGYDVEVNNKTVTQFYFLLQSAGSVRCTRIGHAECGRHRGLLCWRCCGCNRRRASWGPSASRAGGPDCVAEGGPVTWETVSSDVNYVHQKA